AADPRLRGIAFDDRFRLLGLARRRTPQGVEFELAWESLRVQPLDCIVFVHLLDAKRNMVGQLDYAQDEFKGGVKRGDLWRDVLRIPGERLARVESVGMGVIRVPDPPLRIDRGPSDWDGHRLIVAIK